MCFSLFHARFEEDTSERQKVIGWLIRNDYFTKYIRKGISLSTTRSSSTPHFKAWTYILPSIHPCSKFLPLAFVKKQIIEPRHEISSKVVF